MCPECNELSSGNYCSQCGKKISPDYQECPKCQHLCGKTDKYCSLCGALLEYSDLERKVLDGTINLDTLLAKIKPRTQEEIDKLFDRLGIDTDDNQVIDLGRK